MENKFVVVERETRDIISEWDSLDEAKEALEYYEDQDVINSQYKRYFYSIELWDQDEEAYVEVKDYGGDL